MTPELSRRVAAALQRGEPTREERDLLLDSVTRRGVGTVEDMPPRARALLTRLERGTLRSEGGDVA